MVSRVAFCALLVVVAMQRLAEVAISKKHERALLARGAVEHAAEQMPWMVMLHSAWLVCAGLEVLTFHRPFSWALGAPALVLFVAGQVLRLTAMHALGERWTVRVFTLPGAAPVTAGPFKYVRHPNYLGVVLEIAALPLMHGAFLTAIVFSAANGVLLWRRIGAEERALSETSDYARRFREKPRFVPGA